MWEGMWIEEIESSFALVVCIVICLVIALKAVL